MHDLSESTCSMLLPVSHRHGGEGLQPEMFGGGDARQQRHALLEQPNPRAAAVRVPLRVEDGGDPTPVRRRAVGGRGQSGRRRRPAALRQQQVDRVRPQTQQ
jgi:hypothetical protein